MLAVDGPTRSSPRKNAVIATTVHTSDSDTIAAHATASMCRSTSPDASVNALSDRHAPVVTIAVMANGSTPATSVSATRMYVV